jgi:arylsulfatase A-like enzyme/glycosyltransferase involved in cell wall biosynthesis
VGAPAVSVVVATRAEAESLRALLERLRPQVDAAGGELILALNRPREEVAPDRLALCEQLADAVLFEPRPGKSRALNLAIERARGKVCAFIDDDAEPQPGWLAALLEPFAKDGELAGVGGKVLPVLPPSGVPRWYLRLCRGRRTYFLGPRHDLGDQPRDYAPGAFATLPLGVNCAWRRDLVERLRYAEDLGPNSRSGMRGGEDALLARRILDGGARVAYAPGAVVHHPVAPERMEARYVLEGYYWQGVEKARIHRHLGLDPERRLKGKARRRILQSALIAWLEPILPNALAVPLFKRWRFYRGVLDELRGHVGRSIAVLPLLALALLVGACGKEKPVAAAGKPNVLIFLADTLRADHLGCYAYPRPTSPQIDAFAASATRFKHAYAQAPRTVASHASLFTSTYPAVHGAWNRGHAEEGTDGPLPSLSEKADTLAEVLARAGYDTAAFCDGGWLQRKRGLAQGFESFESRFKGAADRVSSALGWLKKRSSSDAPFFLFVHTYEVHTPWLPEPELLELFAGNYQGKLRGVMAQAREWVAAGHASKNPIMETHEKFFEPLLEELSAEDIQFVKAVYDADVRVVDREFARLLAGLKAMGLDQDTLVVFTSDHGEEFGEHGNWEHVQVYEECLRVPLIVRLPGQSEGQVRSETVELVDVMPTLLGELGLPVPAAAQGRALDLRKGSSEEPVRELWAETNEPLQQIAWRRGPLKVLLHTDQEGRSEVYDLSVDPHEARDLAAGEPGSAAAEEARLRLGEWRRAGAEHARKFELDPHMASDDDFDEATRIELQKLGYVGGK